MNGKKFEELPSGFRDAALRALGTLIADGGVGMLLNKQTTGEDVGVKLALEIRKSFCALYSGSCPDVIEEETRASDSVINLDKAEIQSGVSRVKWAEGLIRQLPESHDGRNSWLLNYGSQNNETSTRRAIIEASKKAESAMRSGS